MSRGASKSQFRMWETDVQRVLCMILVGVCLTGCRREETAESSQRDKPEAATSSAPLQQQTRAELPAFLSSLPQEGIYCSGQWTYEYRLTGHQRHRGELRFGNNRFESAEHYDRIQTPWGTLIHLGPDFGFMPTMYRSLTIDELERGRDLTPAESVPVQVARGEAAQPRIVESLAVGVNDPRLSPYCEKLAELNTSSTPVQIEATFGESENIPRLMSMGFESVHTLDNGGQLRIVSLPKESATRWETSARYMPKSQPGAAVTGVSIEGLQIKLPDSPSGPAAAPVRER